MPVDSEMNTCRRGGRYRATTLRARTGFVVGILVATVPAAAGAQNAPVGMQGPEGVITGVWLARSCVAGSPDCESVPRVEAKPASTYVSAKALVRMEDPVRWKSAVRYDYPVVTLEFSHRDALSINRKIAGHASDLPMEIRIMYRNRAVADVTVIGELKSRDVHISQTDGANPPADLRAFFLKEAD